MHFRAFIFTVMIGCLLASAGWAQDDSGLPTAVITKREMVVTANPLATGAGARILKMGGTAADAMVAVQTVLGLVEPQSSGLGGGAFIVYHDAKTGKTTTIDAREKAPSAATEKRFLDDTGNPLGFRNAWQSGLSVGVPGTPRMMEFMHDKYGRLPWRLLFNQARSLALKGFKLTERTSSQVAGLLERNSSCEDGVRLYFRDPAAFEYFVDTDDCTAKPAGTRMRNPAYARTLKALARKGADAFYYGAIARDIADAVQGDLNIGGDMTVEDLANYRVVVREPVCIDYRGYRVCGMGPPSSGALAVGQILGILENFDLTGYPPLDVEVVHFFTQAGRLAFADRNKYVADSDFITVPVVGMLDKDYLADRAALITGTDMGTAEPGTPPDDFDPYAPDPAAKLSGTSHVSIVDRYGNALSMTTTIESSFGNGVMVRGFLLNNELTDFSFAFEDDDGVPIANRVQPDKRPRSSMSPTIVFDEEGEVALVTGSPGGSRIIGYTAQSIMNVLDFGLDPQEAINVPHYMNRNGRTDLEEPIPGVTLDYDAGALAAELVDRGHSGNLSVPPEDRVGIIAQTSGLSIIQVVECDHCGRGKWHAKGRCHKHSYLIGGADQRRDGAVGGR
ncbi:gamma-glutamyltranspeptidase [Desulfosarcina alkanivorans]|uniref:Glutathione hydrolase proenzyme n=1 Tax=Desulfosarcina alkanivorans TaxID=571177 RepID=A0A5K7YFN2_9BACT|nr:gamma-glutamyltransferase [Desulfosarcina alkanivorans]BBO67858.1 gamma-glutamyltranspeptidase [Desulfosarcina alkanivorans]